MASCELMRNNTTRYCLFAVDSKSDLDMLPTSERVGSGDLIRSTTCCIGSRARGSDGTLYVLNGSNKWAVYSQSSGGGGGGGSTSIDDITDEEIEDLFSGEPHGGDDDEPITDQEIEDMFGESGQGGEADDIEPITDGEIEGLFGN